jgi:hypothetical protein
MTLWSIFRSPLIFGGDLPSNDAATIALITNQEVIEVNQRSSGGHELKGAFGSRVWIANGTKSGEFYVAVFNLEDYPVGQPLSWTCLGISGPVSDVRDVWAHKSVDTTHGFEVQLRPHASALYRITTAKSQ